MKELLPVPAERLDLVEQHLPLVRWVILSGFGYNENIVGLELDDLLQEGAVALCHAAATYREGKTAFSTYAVKVIRNHLLSYCREVGKKSISYDVMMLDGALSDDIYDFERERISRLCASELLSRRKKTYKGAAKRGLYALELKVLDGYGVTDIAHLYNTKPNLVGAWISKATKQIREDLSPGELEEGNHKQQKEAA